MIRNYSTGQVRRSCCWPGAAASAVLAAVAISMASAAAARADDSPYQPPYPTPELTAGQELADVNQELADANQALMGADVSNQPGQESYLEFQESFQALQQHIQDLQGSFQDLLPASDLTDKNFIEGILGPYIGDEYLVYYDQAFATALETGSGLSAADGGLLFADAEVLFGDAENALVDLIAAAGPLVDFGASF